MSLKSLLTTVVIAGAATSAFAFPELKLYPAPGTVTDVQYFASVNISTANEDEAVSVVDDATAKPYLESVETGDVVNCTEFFYFELAQANLLKFEIADITENGEWELVFPAGCLKDGEGNLNEKLTYTYNLDDPNLGAGNFPQITLVSSNPANNALLPTWGGSLDKVTFVTSDDSAVNYIDWYLYDITNGASESEREWMTQGSENRFDPNRGDGEDQWADGLFISVAGNAKLIEGRTYRLTLRFCGIGYDPVTGNYPTDVQIAKSTELETYLDFRGQTKGTEYSPYIVENVSPDPEVYEFDNLDMRTFSIVYSGPVKPESFTYPIGMGAGTSPAGEIAAGSDLDADGCATVWDFTFDESVLKSALGEIMVTIKAKDKDGLYVKGNAGYSTDDFNYNIMWKANAGADQLTSVEPENEAVVKELSSITISNEKNKTMFLSYNAAEKPAIVSRNGTTVLDDPTFSDDEKTATFTFETITEPGIYTLIIPKYYFNIGTEFDGTSCNRTTFTYTIEGNEEPGDEAKQDLVPASSSVENNANITTTLDKIVLTFANMTLISFDPIVPGSLLRKADASDEYTLVEEIEPVDNDFFNPTEYTYTFSTPLSEAGTYRFFVPAGTFFDEAYDESGKTSGHFSPELVYNFTIAGTLSGVESILTENGVANVYDIAGRMVLENADAAQIKALNAGVYIINGKKYVVK
ncbi:MAG: hypothetical protein HDS95_03735 [Bacteroidales bacterium]|nr:hypothetical protein [Bacteroidales bacterium]